MKNIISSQKIRQTLVCIVFFISFSIKCFSQTTSYNCIIKNLTIYSPSTFAFDISIEKTGTNSLALNGFQAGIYFNYSAMANGGTITAHLGSSSLGLNVDLNPVSKQIRVTSGYIGGINIPPPPGIIVGTIVVANSVPFTQNVLPAFTWSFEKSSSTKRNTLVLCFVNGGMLSSNITLPSNHFVTTLGAEVCDNGIDDNTNGLIDEGCPSPKVFISHPRLRCITTEVFNLYAFNGPHPSGQLVLEVSPQLLYDPLFFPFPPPDNIVGNKYYFHFTDQQLYSLKKIASIAFIIPPANNNVCINLKMHPVDSAGNVDYFISYVYGLCDVISCSFDPNEKTVNPPENTVQPFDSWFNYTVFFQNTGNDTAYNINIVDTLNPALDKYTFHVLESSHPYTSSISSNNVVNFSFPNIYLPDSNVNEPGSHGFITYVIKTLAGINTSTFVMNTADIYFDLNPPIRTNTTVNILSDDPCFGITLDDGNICTVDACDTLNGVTHEPVDVDDGNPCTVDGCNSITGVYHNLTPEICGNQIDDNCDGQTDENCGVTLNLRLLIEGLYRGLGKMAATIDGVNYPQLCDTIIVELHDAIDPYNVAYSNKSTIDIDGNGIFTFPNNALNNYYYLAIHHRNAIETWSASPILVNGTTLNYTFTTAANKAYGDNLRDLGDGNFAMWSGDIIDAETNTPGRQDGIVESSDYGEMENAVYFIYQGYTFQDITGDGLVESGDYSLEENNVYYVTVSMHP